MGLVITSQYFIWYISLLPCLWNGLKSIGGARALLLIGLIEKLSFQILKCILAIWFLGQGLWLLPAYYFEHEGVNTFHYLHLGAILHFAANIGCILTLIRHYRPLKLKTS